MRNWPGLLTKRGHVVRCCLTEAGSRFITPLTLASLTGQPCFGANPEYHEWRPNPIIEHVDLARWADVVAVAPATADIMGKTANGLANDLLSTLLLATTAKVLWAPAMNKAMWAHPAVQANVARLKGFGHTVVEPAEGMLACGEEGAGRLAEVADIADAVDALAGPAHPALLGRAVLITAGPTQEDLDPVRTLTNRSSGAMGIELARAFRNAGAKVSLVLGGDLPAPWGVRHRAGAQRPADAGGQPGAVAGAGRPGGRRGGGRPAAPGLRPGEGEEGRGSRDAWCWCAPRTCWPRSPPGAAPASGCWASPPKARPHVPNATAKLHMKHLDGILVNDIGGGKGFGLQANVLIPITASGQGEPLGPLPKDRLAQAVVRWWGDWLGAKG